MLTKKDKKTVNKSKQTSSGKLSAQPRCPSWIVWNFILFSCNHRPWDYCYFLTITILFGQSQIALLISQKRNVTIIQIVCWCRQRSKFMYKISECLAKWWWKAFNDYSSPVPRVQPFVIIYHTEIPYLFKSINIWIF